MILKMILQGLAASVVIAGIGIAWADSTTGLPPAVASALGSGPADTHQTAATGTQGAGNGYLPMAGAPGSTGCPRLGCANGPGTGTGPGPGNGYRSHDGDRTWGHHRDGRRDGHGAREHGRWFQIGGEDNDDD